jgi:HEAT repeat protein
MKEAFSAMKQPNRATYELLLKAMTGTNAQVASEAKSALSVMNPGDAAITQQLRTLMKNENPEIRSDAIWVLGNWRSKDPFLHEAIIATLADPSPIVRKTALNAIETGMTTWNVRSWSALAKLTTNPESEVRKTAFMFLREFRAPLQAYQPAALRGVLDSNSEVRTAVLSLLANQKAWGPELERAVAASFLKFRGDPSTGEKITDLYTSSFTPRNIQDAKAQEIYVRALAKGGEATRIAKRILSTSSPLHPEALSQLTQQALKHPDKQVRNAAQSVLSQKGPELRQAAVQATSGHCLGATLSLLRGGN